MCEWDVARYFIFSANGEPLIYYSHLTSIAIFLALLGFTFLRLKKWPKNSFRLMAGAYIVWLFCDLILWANDKVEHVLFFWTLINLVEPLIFAAAFLYFLKFVDGEMIGLKTKWFIFIALLPTLVMAPLGLSVIGFDYTTCDRNVIEGVAAYYNYFLEAVFIGLIVFKAASALISKKFAGKKSRIFLSAMGTSLLLLSFLTANFLGTFTGDYVTSQYGHIAVPIFAAFLAYITIKYESFEPRILLIDTLTTTLFILLLSLIFVESQEYQVYANVLAFIVAIPLAYTLGTNIRKEVKTRKQIQELAVNLEAANTRLKQLDAAKNEFLSVASHQLRAPLTAIRGYASNIIDGTYGEVPANIVQPLQVLQESGRLMANAIEDYLNISRIEQGRMKYEKSVFDISDLAGKVVDELEPVATSKSLRLLFSTDGPFTVNADIGKIKQVLTNLVDNAIKYTESGSVTVAVAKKDSVARITVSDTGVGISPEEIEKLFSKFSRAREANKVNTTGTGLGLYVAKQLTEGNGGKIWVESEGLGKGSRFIIELPAS